MNVDELTRTLETLLNLCIPSKKFLKRPPTLLDVLQHAFDGEGETQDLCVFLEGDLLRLTDVKDHGLHVDAEQVTSFKPRYKINLCKQQPLVPQSGLLRSNESRQQLSRDAKSFLGSGKSNFSRDAFASSMSDMLAGEIGNAVRTKQKSIGEKCCELETV